MLFFLKVSGQLPADRGFLGFGIASRVSSGEHRKDRGRCMVLRDGYCRGLTSYSAFRLNLPWCTLSNRILSYLIAMTMAVSQVMMMIP